jgi:magnesium and cobalt transporter
MASDDSSADDRGPKGAPVRAGRSSRASAAGAAAGAGGASREGSITARRGPAAKSAGAGAKPPTAPAKPGGWRNRLTRTLAGGIREPAQLLELLREAATRGLLDADALAMVEGSLSMAGLQTRDLMVPRADMVCIRRDETLASILPAVIASGHSRFPVLDGDRDDVVGILLAKDLLRASAAGNGHGGAARPRFDMREYMRPVVFVPESKRLNVLLKEFRGNRNHMAIVVDEYGGVAGLITIEDVIEQVIGEIDDEFDVEDDQNIRAGDDGHSVVRGATRIDEFNAHFATELPDAEFDTIAGLVMQQFGRVPRRGESAAIGDLGFQVLRMDRRRIDALRVEPLEPASARAAGDTPGEGGEGSAAASGEDRDAGG